MKKYLALLLATVLLSGCVTTQLQKTRSDVNAYIEESRPKALSGQMKWTDYYIGLIDRLKQLPDSTYDKSFYIDIYSQGFEMAKKFEMGQLSKEDFYKWRDNANKRINDWSAQVAKFDAECKFESVSRANPNSSVEYSGNNINRQLSSAITGGYEIAMRQNQIYELCIRSKIASVESGNNLTKVDAKVSSSDMEQAKTKCIDLGFKAGTESFGQCILRLTK